MTVQAQVSLKSEIMLQVNERLYIGGLIGRELYEQAKAEIVKHERG